MGRELHDSTAQTLVALQLKVMYLKEMLDDRRYRSLLSEVEDTIHELHEEIRAVSFVSSLPPIKAGTLPAALRVMSAQFGQLTGLRISFGLKGVYTGWPTAMEASVYRIAQEGLANVYRHAKASSAQVRLELTPSAMRLVIDDDGIGIRRRRGRAQSSGVGLHNIRQRVRELDGRLAFRRLKRGSRFTVSIPR